MKNKKERVSTMDPELTTSIAQIVAGITLLAMAWFLTKRP